ncbi:MAG: M20/M25/M40 family metallo-hydrolase [Streptosporangiales bacterium]|nr:M20/M25/M40 family metallo-hydrolase [Streptosporangiales bacterium]
MTDRVPDLATRVSIETEFGSAVDARLTADVARIADMVRQPSVSIDGLGVRESGHQLADALRELGCDEVEVVDTPAHPVVWAYLDAGADRTLVNYGMYDTRPTGDPKSWTGGDPFSGTVAPADGFPAVMYGRGGLVPKGPTVAWLAAITTYREARGQLPFNIAFLFEGSEIIGSPGYLDVAARYADRITDPFGCVYLRASQKLTGEMQLFLGYKAFFTIELTASGASWGRGPSTAAVHSANRTIVDSPTERLVHALSTLVTPDGEIAVEGWRPGYTGDVLRPTEKPLVDALVERYRGAPWQEVMPGLAGGGVERFAGDVLGKDVLDRYLYASSLNIQGLYAGYTGPGTRTYTIPSAASALLDLRLVTDQSTDEVIGALREHLDAHGYRDIEMDVRGAFDGWTSSPDSPLVSAFVDASEQFGASMDLWPRTGGGGPWAALARRFDVPVIMGAGVGTGKRGGAVDEYLVIDGGGRAPGLREMELFGITFIDDLGRVLAAEENR